MKRLAICAAAVLLLAAGCGTKPQTPTPTPTPTPEGKKVELTLWTYPVGGWGQTSTVSSQLASFHRDYPNINITAKVVDYTTGDAEVRAAIDEGRAPDLILEGPERLVAQWGAEGAMVDIKDLWTGEKADAIQENVRVACHDGTGKYYIYPMCMTTHCMAINRDLFEEADAWQYVDEKTHTWTTENFFRAVDALKAHGMENVCAVYCGGQGGDQGTRALVNNLYDGTFTDATHTHYTVESEENIHALTELKAHDGILFADNMAGADEIEKFCKEELAMAFCWSVSQEVTQTINKALYFDVFPMAFPTDDGKPELQGGIWGFGIFDNGDTARIDAAKQFIRYILQNDERYISAVNVSAYWPVREVENLYVNDTLMNEYGIFGQYLGDYYQVAPNWAEARTAWWQMLQEVGKGTDIASAVKAFSEKVNKGA